MVALPSLTMLAVTPILAELMALAIPVKLLSDELMVTVCVPLPLLVKVALL